MIFNTVSQKQIDEINSNLLELGKIAVMRFTIPTSLVANTWTDVLDISSLGISDYSRVSLIGVITRDNDYFPFNALTDATMKLSKNGKVQIALSTDARPGYLGRECIVRVFY